LPKTSQQCGQSEKNPSESIGRDPPGDGAYCDRKRSQSISRLASRQTAAILSGIIINKNLKLLLINYLARKVDFLFHFPSRSQYTWDRTYGRTAYNTYTDFSGSRLPDERTLSKSTRVLLSSGTD